MKFLVVLAVAVACASADVSHVVKDDSSAPVLSASFDLRPEGSFNAAYETGNGISAQSSGTVRNTGAESSILALNGGYRYTAPDGEIIEVTYEADENGFRPVGKHIPVAPAIPEAIARSLAYIAAHPTVAAKVSGAAYSVL